MEREPLAGTSVTEPSRRSGLAMYTWLLVALLTHLLLVDAAAETFWAGLPLRWWVSPALLAFVALSLWLWRPGGGRLRRLGPPAAAATPLFGLLTALAVTAWQPEGQVNGVRALLQPTPAVFTLAAIAAVVLATFVIVQALALAPSRWKWVARAVFVLLGAYAVAALVAALRHRAAYAALFQGNPAWSSLPFWLQGPFLGLLGLVPLAIVGQLGRVALDRNRRWPLRVVGRQTLALVLALAMSLAPVSVPGVYLPSGAAPGPQVRQEADASAWHPAPGQIRNLFRALDAATRKIDRTRFDPAAIVQAAGSNTDTLFEWVRDNTGWVPYRGALRGPVGMVMDRSGNSLDRALLLGELLQLGGHTARLARARVPAATAEGWLARMPKQPAAPSAPLPVIDTLLAGADTAAAESGAAAADLRQVFLAVNAASEKLADDAARRVSDYTRAVLEKVDRPADDDGAAAAVLAALADHWWVQVLQDGQWSDFDPLLPDAKPGAAVVAPQATIALSKADGKVHLDRMYCQEVDLRVVAEQRRGSSLAEHEALRQTLRPSDLFGQPVSLQNEPVKWPASLDLSKEPDPTARLRVEALRQTEWLPILRIGARQIEGSVIEDTGRVKPRGSAGPGGIGGPMGGLGGFLGGGEEADTGDGVLTAVWLDYVISVPGEAPRTVRRPLVDLIGPAARKAAKNGAAGDTAGRLSAQQLETRALAMLDRIDVLVQGSKYAPEYVVHQGATHLLAQQNSVVSAVEAGNAAPEDGREALDRLMPESAALLNLAVARFSRRFGSPPMFVERPNVLNWRSGLRFDSGKGPVLRESFDVVHNPVAPLPPSWQTAAEGSRASAVAFESRVRQGVVDTVLEGALLADAEARYSVPAFFDAAAEQSIATGAVRPGDAPRLAAMGLPPDVAALAEAGLNAGCHLVLPSRSIAVDGVPRFCWWRVDARSGETVGILDTGFHQGEYAQTLRVGVVRAVYREASKKAVRWVARRGFQFYNGWTAPPHLGSLCWDWGTIATFAWMGACLAGAIGAIVWSVTSDP